jgi:hypothetical protein
LAAAALAAVAFTAVIFTGVPFTAVALTAMAPAGVALAAVDDSDNERNYQCSSGYIEAGSRYCFNQVSSLVHGFRFTDDCHLGSRGVVGR